ncbi:MAG: 5'/3'-nucleotidase SurE [Gemmatimonadetes bacterium]|nr:5'/3'-nucleotidase SurE [Gemmatimonadota bacterium]
MNILLTNDDSHDSPLFHFAVEKFREVGDLVVVVPLDEQSWKGKSITRFGDLHLSEIDVPGGTAYTLNGTPADCVNFGIHHLHDKKPDLVVSGINMGRNTGVAFAYSSGTIGACFEGNIAGIPGIALSQVLAPCAFQYWIAQRTLPAEELARIRRQADEVVDKVMDMYRADDTFGRQRLTWNLNMPFQTTEGWEIRETFLGHSVYGSCFKKEGDVYRHRLERRTPDTREGSDVATTEAGHVSLTRLDMFVLGQ